jgi:hypothetical protein
LKLPGVQIIVDNSAVLLGVRRFITAFSRRKVPAGRLDKRSAKLQNHSAAPSAIHFGGASSLGR